MLCKMDSSGLEILKHHKDGANGIITIFRHKTNSQQVYLFREESLKTEALFRSITSSLSQRKRIQSPHLCQIHRVNWDPVKRDLNLMSEFSLHNAMSVNLASFESFLRCFGDALRGLVDLHSNGLHHGNIRPECILYFPSAQTFKLMDRLIPIVAPYTFYRSQFESQSDLFISPKLFNEIASKSVKSMKVNFVKNDVFALGMTALKILYPKKMNLKNFYSTKHKLFDTYTFLETLNKIASETRNQIESDFLSLIRKKFVCYDETQRLSPAAALMEIEAFIKSHYSNFSNMISWKNIVLEFNVDERTSIKKIDSKNSLESSNSQFTFKPQSESGLSQNFASTSKKNIPQTNSKPMSKEPSKPDSLVDTKKNAIEEAGDYDKEKVNKSRQFEKMIDFEELHTQSVNRRTSNTDLEHTDATPLAPKNDKDDFQNQEETTSKVQEKLDSEDFYKIMLKVDVVKVTKSSILESKDTLYDLDTFSKFEIGFEKDIMQIRSKSLTPISQSELQKLQHLSYGSLIDAPLSLNLLSKRSRGTKNSEVPNQTQPDSSLSLVNPMMTFGDSTQLFNELLADTGFRTSQIVQQKDSCTEGNRQIEGEKIFSTYSNLPSETHMLSSCNSSRINNIYRTQESNNVRPEGVKTVRYKIESVQLQPQKLQTRNASKYAQTIRVPNTSSGQLHTLNNNLLPRVVKRISIDGKESRLYTPIGLGHQR